MERYNIRNAVIDEMEYNTQTYSNVESSTRNKYLHEILRKVTIYERYLEIYDVKEIFKNKGMEWRQIYNIDEIREKWDHAFTKDISLEQKDEIYYNQFKWHVFCTDVLSAYENNEADSIFLEIEKGEAYLFTQLTEECFVIHDIGKINKEDLLIIHELISDFYLFDIAGKWTYIRTHEPDIGPYFYIVK